jgi:type I restriction enzyme R subunit
MSDIGQIERKTQNRVVALLRDRLGYSSAGNLEDQANSNIRDAVLSGWLTSKGSSPIAITKAIEVLSKVANDSTKSLYDRNRAVYELLRYGVKVIAKYGKLTEAEIQQLVVDDKWIGAVETVVGAELARVASTIVTRIKQLDSRYCNTMPNLSDSVTAKATAVEDHPKKMGLSW